jgi:hypothetical protein
VSLEILQQVMTNYYKRLREQKMQPALTKPKEICTPDLHQIASGMTELHDATKGLDRSHLKR